MVAAARALRALLDDLGSEGWVKTTGGAGLHMVIPIEPRRDWSVCLQFAKSVAASMIEHDPTRYALTLAKRGRERQILIDYLRNNRTNTAVSAYSIRARVGVPVSVPTAWDELSSRSRPQRWTIRTVLQRVCSGPDPWDGYFSSVSGSDCEMARFEG